MDATQLEKAYLWLFCKCGHYRKVHAKTVDYWLERSRDELCQDCIRKLADFERAGKKPEMSGV